MHPLDELADYLRTAPLGFVGFGPGKIARALAAIEDAKRPPTPGNISALDCAAGLLRLRP